MKENQVEQGAFLREIGISLKNGTKLYAGLLSCPSGFYFIKQAMLTGSSIKRPKQQCRELPEVALSCGLEQWASVKSQYTIVNGIEKTWANPYTRPAPQFS